MHDSVIMRQADACACVRRSNLAFSMRRAAEAAAGGRGAGRGGAGRGGAFSGAGYGIQKPLGGVRPAQKATPAELQRIATCVALQLVMPAPLHPQR
jgi:hypothetical protein